MNVCLFIFENQNIIMIAGPIWLYFKDSFIGPSRIFKNVTSPSQEK